MSSAEIHPLLSSKVVTYGPYPCYLKWSRLVLVERKVVEVILWSIQPLCRLKPHWKDPRALRGGCENLSEISANVRDWPLQAVIVSWCTALGDSLPGWLLDVDANAFLCGTTPGKPCLCEQVCRGHFWTPQVEKVFSLLIQLVTAASPPVNHTCTGSWWALEVEPISEEAAWESTALILHLSGRARKLDNVSEKPHLPVVHFFRWRMETVHMDINPVASLKFPFLALHVCVSEDQNTRAQCTCPTHSLGVCWGKLLPNVRMSEAVVGTYLKL